MEAWPRGDIQTFENPITQAIFPENYIFELEMVSFHFILMTRDCPSPIEATLFVKNRQILSEIKILYTTMAPCFKARKFAGRFSLNLVATDVHETFFY